MIFRLSSVVLASVAMTMAPYSVVSAQGGAIPKSATPVMKFGGPTVGDQAPDVTMRVTTRFGDVEQPLTLSSLKGRTVVLAFFPGARTPGCTVQMEKYRDMYSELFPSSKVIVIGVSVDADTTLSAWASEADFPMVFTSDASGTIGKAYGAYDERIKRDRRLLYVIGPDGKVAYTAKPFDVSKRDAYAELGDAVKKTL